MSWFWPVQKCCVYSSDSPTSFCEHLCQSENLTMCVRAICKLGTATTLHCLRLTRDLLDPQHWTPLLRTVKTSISGVSGERKVKTRKLFGNNISSLDDGSWCVFPHWKYAWPANLRPIYFYNLKLMKLQDLMWNLNWDASEPAEADCTVLQH